MAKKKPTGSAKGSSKDRHTSRRMVRLPDDIHQQLRLLAERNARPLSWELRLALIRHLETNGLWPPQEPPSSE